MGNMVQLIGKSALEFSQGLGKAGIFLSSILARKPQLIRSFSLVIQQIYASGVRSLLVIFLAGLFIGMVVALQGFYTLNKFGASAQLGQLIALSLVRELGPVVTALLFAGRAGSALTAEIGLMKSTEQLSSLEMMAVDPIRRIISPRFWGAFIALPLLTLIFSATAIIGGHLVGVEWLGVKEGSFWGQMSVNVNFYNDIVKGMMKTILFGFVISWIAVFQGYDTIPTPEGVSRATTRTVVFSSLSILGLDFVLTIMMMGDW